MKTLALLFSLLTFSVAAQIVTNESYEVLYQIPADQLTQLNCEAWLAATNSQSGLRFGGYAIDSWTVTNDVLCANVRITTSKAQQRVLLGLDPYPATQQASLDSKQATLSLGGAIKSGVDTVTQPADPLNTPPAIVPINDDPQSVFPGWYVKAFDATFKDEVDAGLGLNQ